MYIYTFSLFKQFFSGCAKKPGFLKKQVSHFIQESSSYLNYVKLI